MKFTDTSPKDKTSGRMMLICNVFFMLVIILLSSRVIDFVTNAVAKSDAYEVKYEADKETGNGNMEYRLYKNGEYITDVDYNRYYLLDSEGHTDFKYCKLMDDAGELAYITILCAMIIFVIRIVMSTAKSTPFTRANVNCIRIISLLQIALAVVPGTVKVVMSFLRFYYASGTFSIGGFYMFIIGFVIAMIAQVFDYGVKLQEDSDSIA